MSGQTINITLTIDEVQALAVWKNETAAADKLADKMARLEMKNKPLSPLQAGAEAVVGTLKDAAMQLVGIGSSVDAVLAFANQLKAEIENIRSRQGGSADSALEYAAELPKATKAAGGKVNVMEMDQLILAGSKDTGKSQAEVASAYTSAFAAIGPTTKEELLDTIEVANAVMNAYQDEDRDTTSKMVSAIAHNKRAFKMTTPEAIGFVQMLGNQTFPDSAAALAGNVAPQVPGIAQAGNINEAEAAALYGTMSQIGGDREGAKSGAAARNLMSALAERLPEIATGMDRIKYMREHPELLPKLFDGGEFDGGEFGKASLGLGEFKPIISQILSADSLAANDLDQRLATAGNRKEWVRQQQEIQADINSHPITQIAMAKQQVQTSQKQIQVDDTGGALASVARQGMQDILKAAGVSDVEQQYASAAFEYNTSLGSKDPLKEVRRQLSDQIDTLESPQSYSDTRALLSGLTLGIVPYSLEKKPEEMASDKQKAKRLREARSQLEIIGQQFSSSDKRRKEQLAKADEAEKVKPTPPLKSEKVDPTQPGKQPNKSQTAKELLASAELAVNDFANDTTQTEDELRGTRQKVKRAATALNQSSGTGNAGGEAVAMNTSLRLLTEKLDKLALIMEGNSKATAENTQAQGGPSGPRRPPLVSSMQNAPK